MKYLLSALSMAACGAGFAVAAPATAASQPDLTLEKIMADPDWIGPPVKDAYWSADGRTVYYSLKRSASPISDLHRIDPKSNKPTRVGYKELEGGRKVRIARRSGEVLDA